MEYTVPDYYEQFSCLAGACPATCCAGWQIEIDGSSLESYLAYQQKGAGFGNRLVNGIDWQEGVFCQDQHKRCEFLNEENLCDIYSEAGRDMLCLTCRTYPRHIEEFEGLKEMSLCLSCPEAARIILSREESVKFIRGADEEEEELYDEFDYFLYSNLVTAREYLLETLQNREVPIYQRMLKTIITAGKVQACIENDRLFQCEEAIAAQKEIGFGDSYKRSWKNFEERLYSLCDMKALWYPYREELEILDEGWSDLLKRNQERLHHSGGRAYKQKLLHFEQGCPAWGIVCEQLLVYWIYAYFCGAVYDENSWGKVGLAVMSTLLVRDLAAAQFEESGGMFGKDELIELCIRYSREIEHSDHNLLALEENDFLKRLDC